MQQQQKGPKSVCNYSYKIVHAGAGLSICNTDVLQCCDETYISAVKDSTEELVRRELRARIQEPADTIREINSPIFSCKLR